MLTKSELPSKRNYRLLFVPSAWTEWRSLDNSVKVPLRKILKKRLDVPHVPGGALHGDLKGYYKITLKAAGIRLVYGVDEIAKAVIVMAVDRREDSLVYRSALARRRRS